MTTRPSRQVRFVRAQFDQLASGRCAARVELRGAAATYEGRAEGGCIDVEGLRAAAWATAHALRDLGHQVEVQGVEMVMTFGEPAVVVRVMAEHDEETRRLVGYCLVGNDGLRAAPVRIALRGGPSSGGPRGGSFS